MVPAPDGAQTEISRHGARVGDLVVARYGRHDYAEGRVKIVNKDGTCGVLFQDNRYYGKVHDMRLSQQGAENKTLFDLADADESGTIDFEEFVGLHHDESLTRAELWTLFQTFDVDRSGAMDRHEFARYRAKWPNFLRTRLALLRVSSSSSSD